MKKFAYEKVKVERIGANHFVIRTKKGVYLQSYNVIIVFIDRKKGKKYLDNTYWDYSRTTAKYRRIFLREDITETREKIKRGEYILAELND